MNIGEAIRHAKRPGLRRALASVRSVDGILLGALALSLVANVVLARHARQARPAGKPVPTLAAGTRPGALEVQGSKGIEQLVSFPRQGKKGVVVYAMMPNCGWCLRNEANVRAIVAAAGSDYEFVGVSLETAGLEAYQSPERLGFAVHADPTPDSRQRYALGGTPQTIVLASDGSVVRNWPGAYDNGTATEVAAFFGATLPGLAEPSERERTAPHCRDRSGAYYGPGAVVDGLRCSADGEWR